MQTCSNCGASNRDGAKFCTTCGTRLNAAAPAGTGSWGALDTDETRVETPAVTTTTAEPTTTSTPAWDDEAPVSTAWSWNQTRTSEELAVPAETTTEAPASSSWANQWTSAEADDFGDDDESATTTPEPVAEMTTTTTTTTDAPVWDAPPPVIADATTTTDAPAWTTTTTAPEPDVVDNTTPVDNVIPVATTADAPVTSDDTAPVTAGASGTTALGPRSRAQELIAELQGLIDTSFADPAADTDGDTATALTALATIGGDDGSRFDDLRETVEKARTQPRDLDTMLALIGQVETISNLLDAYEAQRTAIAEARASLEG